MIQLKCDRTDGSNLVSMLRQQLEKQEEEKNKEITRVIEEAQVARKEENKYL